MNLKILIVEYDVKTIDTIKEILPYSSIVFEVVEDGLKAKKALTKDNFDLVITAAMLPKFHGFQLSEFIAKEYSQIKTIIISGIYKGVDYRHQAITQFKAVDFFEKPLMVDKFKSRIVEILNLDLDELEKQNSLHKTNLIDTAKIPLYNNIKKKEENLTSDDIFGDIIKDVEKSKPSNDILPENSIKINQPSKKKTSKNKSFDMSILDDLVKKPIKKKIEKKIETDISRKLEDTLSGLGLSNKSVKKKHVTPPKINIEPKIEHSPQPPIQEVKDEPQSEEKYDILGLIARGGMAEIYKAKKRGVKGFKKIIALKKILSGYGEDNNFIEMFIDEAKIVAELTHPNIVQIYDFEKKDNAYLIAMEYVQGKDLRKILKLTKEKNDKLPEVLSLYITIKILDALGYAHSAKDEFGNNLDIVHRDVSPPNILISYNGEVKLTDFGVSKASNKMHQTISGALKGKLLYMSPEQAKAEENIDGRSDIYSVGAILFELMTGEKLFADNSEMGVLKKVQEGIIVKPSSINNEIDDELEQIILKTLSIKAEDRYQSADEMIKAIENYISNTYNIFPSSVHLAHYISNLCIEDIENENLTIEMKPVPIIIEKIIKKVVVEPESMEEINSVVEKKPLELLNTEIIDLNIPDNQPEINDVVLPEKKDEFSPAIDINLSMDNQNTQKLEIEEPTMSIDEIEQQLKDQNKIQIEDDIFNNEDKKSKKPLLITIAIIVLVSLLIYFTISSGLFSNKNKKPEGPLTLQLNETNLVDNLLYQKEVKTPFTGFIQSKWSNTNVKEITQYNNGQKDGDYLKYFENKQKEQEGSYLKGKKHNKWIIYSKNNIKLRETNYKSGIKNGQEIIRNKNNNIISNINYSNGVKNDGVIYEYHADNKKKTEIILKNGIETYKRIWDIDGNRLIKGIIINKSKQNKLRIGNRTNIFYEINDAEFTILPKGTIGVIQDINKPETIINIEVTDSKNNKAKVVDINGNKRSTFIEKDKVYIQFTVKKVFVETDPVKIAANTKKLEEEKLAEEKKAEEERIKKAEEEKIKLKKAAEKKLENDKIEAEKKAEEEKIAKEKLIAEEKINKELELENKRIEEARLAKEKENKRKKDLKEGDEVSDVDTPPIPLDTTIPRLSKKLKKRITGDSIQLTVSLFIDENGNVKRIKRIIKSGIPELDLEVSRIVLKWKFKPATKYNKKVKTWFTKSITLKK